MVPIIDEMGLEQGGKNSTSFWMLYNNEQLEVPQQIDFGVPIADILVASIGQANDCVLLSEDLHKLKFLLHLTLHYCQKYQVELSPGKTKLHHLDSMWIEDILSLLLLSKLMALL